MAKSKPTEAKPPAEHHGPQGPVAATLYGPEHLRRVLSLSAEIPVSELCEEAALKIRALEANAPAGTPAAKRDLAESGNPAKAF